MSYTPPPPGGYSTSVQYAAENPRPTSVTVSSLLLYIMAALLLISAALSIFTISSVSQADLIDALETDPNMTGDLAETAAGIAVATVWGTAILYLLIALVIVLCGIFVARGKQWARITSWVFAGFAVLCCGAGGLIGVAAGGLTGAETANQEAIEEVLTGDMPSWISSVNTLFAVLWLLIGIAIIVLLALPPSNAYFRKPEPTWTPPAYPTV
jgi:hypothetical protein